MAEERLGASFSIDVTQLKAGLTQANRLIRESESQFKSAAAGMDDWSKSEEGLNAKIKSLSEITDLQKKKVSALKTEYKNLVDNGLDPTSAEAIKLRTQINNEEAALKSNEAELKRQKEALKDVKNGTEEASAGFEKFSNVAKAAAKAAAAAMAAAGAAIIGISKQALDSYAEYEQLIGGVDTLFGKSSKKVQEYAANAYKTAGLSANEYMETVTGMSASLIQSLGGDTEKAAEKANMAITDMSDNANKMGTDIESLQNAYGGFAKGNFTMLDNLKLGYGGTKEEMQRLLEDATKLSGVEYDVSSYADIVDAINVVQTELGITGTTAKEASTTIQGSIASMKGAWSNLLTGLADENADIDGLIEQLIDSVSTVIANVLPRIKVIISGIIKMIAELLPQIPPLLASILPDLIDGVMGLINGIVEVLPQIVDLIVDILPQLIQAILGMLPSLLDAAIQIVVALVNGLTQMLPQIIDTVMELIPELIIQLVNSIPLLLDAAIQLLMALIEAVPTIQGALVDALPKIISTITSTLIANIPLLLKAAIKLFMALIQAIPEVMSNMKQEVPNIIKGIVEGIKDGVPKMLEAGKDLIKGLWNGIKDMKDWIIDKVKGFGDNILGGLKDFFGIHSPSKVMENVVGKNLALGIGEGFEKNIGKVNDQITGAMEFGSPSINVNKQQNEPGFGVGKNVVVNQNNYYSQAHSRFELYKSKQQTAAAVRLAMGTV